MPDIVNSEVPKDVAARLGIEMAKKTSGESVINGLLPNSEYLKKAENTPTLSPVETIVSIDHQLKYLQDLANTKGPDGKAVQWSRDMIDLRLKGGSSEADGTPIPGYEKEINQQLTGSVDIISDLSARPEVSQDGQSKNLTANIIRARTLKDIQTRMSRSENPLNFQQAVQEIQKESTTARENIINRKTSDCIYIIRSPQSYIRGDHPSPEQITTMHDQAHNQLGKLLLLKEAPTHTVETSADQTKIALESTWNKTLTGAIKSPPQFGSKEKIEALYSLITHPSNSKDADTAQAKLQTSLDQAHIQFILPEPITATNTTQDNILDTPTTPKSIRVSPTTTEQAPSITTTRAKEPTQNTKEKTLEQYQQITDDIKKLQKELGTKNTSNSTQLTQEITTLQRQLLDLNISLSESTNSISGNADQDYATDIYLATKLANKPGEIPISLLATHPNYINNPTRHLRLLHKLKKSTESPEHLELIRNEINSIETAYKNKLALDIEWYDEKILELNNALKQDNKSEDDVQTLKQNIQETQENRLWPIIGLFDVETANTYDGKSGTNWKIIEKLALLAISDQDNTPLPVLKGIINRHHYFEDGDYEKLLNQALYSIREESQNNTREAEFSKEVSSIAN